MLYLRDESEKILWKRKSLYVQTDICLSYRVMVKHQWFIRPFIINRHPWDIDFGVLNPTFGVFFSSESLKRSFLLFQLPDFGFGIFFIFCMLTGNYLLTILYSYLVPPNFHFITINFSIVVSLKFYQGLKKSY